METSENACIPTISANNNSENVLSNEEASSLLLDFDPIVAEHSFVSENNSTFIKPSNGVENEEIFSLDHDEFSLDTSTELLDTKDGTSLSFLDEVDKIIAENADSGNSFSLCKQTSHNGENICIQNGDLEDINCSQHTVIEILCNVTDSKNNIKSSNVSFNNIDSHNQVTEPFSSKIYSKIEENFEKSTEEMLIKVNCEEQNCQETLNYELSIEKDSQNFNLNENVLKNNDKKETCSEFSNDRAENEPSKKEININENIIKDIVNSEKSVLINDKLENSTVNIPQVTTQENASQITTDKICDKEKNHENSNLEITKNIAVSTDNLSNEPITTSSKILSKSLENLNLNQLTIEKDKILADFDNQKVKVTLPPKLEEERKFPRTHKEIISQDLGSIVKNVHGIFTSVSGSLKSAYMQKLPTQQINPNKLSHATSKNTAEGKTINGIETETVDKKELSNSPVKQHDDNNFTIDAGDVLDIEKDKEMCEIKVKQQSAELVEKDSVIKELKSKLEVLTKRLELAERDKDSAVMRYAISESAVIGAREAAEAARKAERAARADAEAANEKLRSARDEKRRICIIYDEKCHEQEASQHEAAKYKEDLKECEGRLKWTQNKWRTETEAYRDAIANVEKLNAKISELESAKNAAANNNVDASRIKTLENELKETQASLIIRRHESKDLEKKLSGVSQQLESSQAELAQANSTIEELRKKVDELTESNRSLEEEAAELASLRAQAALADTLKQQLEMESERASLAAEEACRERARADTCARRESAALQHAAELTKQQVSAAAALRDHQNTARALTIDNASLREKISALEVAVTEAAADLSQETNRRSKECKLLATKIAELTKELEDTKKKLDYEKGENSVLKKKHASSLKELNRELQRALKRCEQLESRAANDQRDQFTPTGSVSSLSSAENGSVCQSEKPVETTCEEIANGDVAKECCNDSQTQSPHLEPDRQTLIERIVRLQRSSARRAERCDFLEEHNRQLTADLKNKSRLLRELMSRQPSGALTSETHDNNKREVARLGGSMAAVWGGASEGMTLELSLEMNNKMQGILEDTLLKNITLKKNIDTLGQEIARLKSEMGAKT